MARPSPRVQQIYDDICNLDFGQKIVLYNMIAADFERAEQTTAAPSEPTVHVPRWLYRILARWS